MVNNLIALDMDHNRRNSTSYTYYNIPNKTFTRIDHIVSTSYDTSSVKNTCDDFPIQLQLSLSNLKCGKILTFVLKM